MYRRQQKKERTDLIREEGNGDFVDTRNKIRQKNYKQLVRSQEGGGVKWSFER
jgi:hypothetical protein